MAKTVARVPFKRIRERAAKRKGGEKVLASLLPRKPDNKALARLGDDRVLSEMACRVFSAGFVWSVIDKKWPGFEEAFLEFNPKRLLFQPAEFWEKLAADKRIVRNPQKIKSVRDNAKFVSDVAAEHGSFGKFLAACSRGPRTPFTPDMLMAIRRPTAVIAGLRDQLAGPPQGLADAIPGAKAVTVPGCDHFALISHGLFKASVFDFFDGWLE